VDRAQQAVYEVVERRTSEDYIGLEAAMWATYNEIEAIGNRGGELFGVPTGFSDLDKLTNGLHEGQLIVVAGRPGLGKSTLGMDFLRSATIGHQKPGVLFSLEMGKSEITMRLLSAEARIPLTRIRTGTLNDDDWTKLARRMGEVAQAPMFIDDSPNLTMMEIRAKARRLKQRHDLKLIVVDYLQLMSSNKRVENRQQEVADMSRSLKLLAKEIQVPVVAISQLNRGPEQRTDKRPLLSDLRESGSIEQDADMVILLHRPDAFERDDPRAGEADLILAKHRNGPTNTITVAHQLHYSRFADLAH
jgi:replicative DNA helicase